MHRDVSGFLRELKARGGLADDGVAFHHASACARALGRCLSTIARKHLERALPRALAEFVHEGHGAPFQTVDALVRHVALVSLAPRAMALEDLVVFCALVREQLSAGDLALLVRDLAPPLRFLFEERPAAPSRAHEPSPSLDVAGPDERRTLSSGRPGSDTPLATATTFADDTSVTRSTLATADDARVDGHTLATGKPNRR